MLITLVYIHADYSCLYLTRRQRRIGNKLKEEKQTNFALDVFALPA